MRRHGEGGSHWVLDGYNVVRGCEELRTAGGGVPRAEREALLAALSSFAAAGGPLRVTVVFDGPAGAFPPVAAPRIRVLFSGGRSADAVIRELADHASRPERLVVVSADRAVAGYARLCGCRTETPEAFLRRAAGPPEAAGGGRPGFTSEQRQRLERELKRVFRDRERR